MQHILQLTILIKNIFPNIILVKELQKKWKSLRDAFRKEHTKYDRSGSQASKKAKYCYYDALSFLTPTFEVRQ